MNQIKILVLTDHGTHAKHDSFYSLFNAIRKNPICGKLYVSSRGSKENSQFFNDPLISDLYGRELEESFQFSINGEWFKKIGAINIAGFDVIFLRLDYPIDIKFLERLQKSYSGLIINKPSGIVNTGTKEYLLRFPELTPFTKIVTTVEDIKKIETEMEVVIKPLRNYGGNGIVRLGEEEYYVENKRVSKYNAYEELKKELSISRKLLVSEFLPRVIEGDNRVIVVNGKVVGSVMRLPAKEGWLCNLNQGGTIVESVLTKEEIVIANETYKHLKNEGVVMYGFDTLVNNNGKRVLTELNTSNVGGFIQIQKLTGINVAQESSDELFKFIQKTLTNR